MSRVKIKFPNENILFVTHIPIRISDINYGNHLGNDALLSIIHESRMQWLAKHEYNELKIEAHGLIMADVMIAYKAEAFYGDVLTITIFADEITNKSFDLLYRITITVDGLSKDIAHAKTGMICYDYDQKKIVEMSEVLKKCLI